jgi:hypothetical protein
MLRLHEKPMRSIIFLPLQTSDVPMRVKNEYFIISIEVCQYMLVKKREYCVGGIRAKR